MHLQVTLGRDVSEYTPLDVEIPDDKYTALREAGGLDAFLKDAARKALDDDDLFYSFKSDTSTAHSLRIVHAQIPGVARVAEDIPLEPDFARAGMLLNDAVTLLRRNGDRLGVPVRISFVQALRALGVAQGDVDIVTNGLVAAVAGDSQ